MAAPDIRQDAPWVTWFAAAWGYAVAAAVLRMVVHAVASPFAADDAYRFGLLIGLAPSVLVGMALSLPTLVVPVRHARMLAAGVVGVGLSGVAMAAHYDAVFNTSPDVSVVALALHPATWASLEGNLPWWLLAIEVIGSLLLAEGVAAGVRRAAGAVTRPPLVLGVHVTAGLAVLLAVPDGWVRVQVAIWDPWLWVAHSAVIEVVEEEASEAVAGPVDAGSVQRLREALGIPHLGVHPTAPLCDVDALQSPAAAQRSVLYVMLEGVTWREAEAMHGGLPVLPNLARAADLGVVFDRMYTVGAQSSAVVPSLYAGLPAHPFSILLQHPPLPALEGFPQQFARAGAATAYVHGADLSFENKRTFLRMVGFQELLEPPPLPPDTARPPGWGEHDEQTFARLQTWVEARRAAGQEYFAALATLSPHDPYVTPDGYTGPAAGRSDFERFVNALHYSDAAFGTFLDWYVQTELPRGTVLIVSGEHAPRLPYPGDSPTPTNGMFEFRFDVPFVLLGLDDAERARATSNRHYAATTSDLGPTAAALAGIALPRCGAGRDLLDPALPADRIVISHAGHRPYFLYLHDGDVRWMWDFRTRRLQAYDLVRDARLANDVAPAHPARSTIEQLRDDYLALTAALERTRNFAPTDALDPTPPNAPAVGDSGPPPFVAAALDPRRPGVSYGHGLRAWAAAQPGPVQVAARVWPASDGALVLSSTATMSGQSGEDWVGRFSTAELQARVDVEVQTATDLVQAVAPGSVVVLLFGPQPRSFLEASAGTAAGALIDVATARGVNVYVVSPVTGILDAAHRAGARNLWWNLEVVDAPPTDIARQVRAGAYTGVVVVASDAGIAVGAAMRALGVPLVVFADEAPDSLQTGVVGSIVGN